MSQRPEISAEDRDHALLAYEAIADERMVHRWLDAADISALTGLPLRHAKEALLLLAGEMKAEVRAGDEDVEFWFDSLDDVPFESSLLRRVRERFAPAGSWLESAGSQLGGIIGAQFAGVLLLGVGAVATQWSPLGMVFIIPAAVLLFPTIVLVFGFVMAVSAYEFYLKDPAMLLLFGPVIGALQIVLFVVAWKMRAWYESLFRRFAPWVVDLTDFGEARGERLGEEKRFVALARWSAGRVKLGDLMVLHGWTRDEAFRRVTRLVVDYGGDVEVDADGQMVFVFPRFADELETVPPEPIWEHATSPKERLGVSGQNAGRRVLTAWSLTFVALYVWISKIASLPLAEMLVNALPGGTSTLTALGALFAAIPLVVLFRMVAIRLREGRHSTRVERYRLLERIARHAGAIRQSIADVDDDVVLDFDGTVREESAEDGKVVLAFPELERSRYAAQVTARAE